MRAAHWGGDWEEVAQGDQALQLVQEDDRQVGMGGRMKWS